MDFQNVADSIGAMTCIISVEKLPGGGYGDIRIVTGNRSYIDSIEKPLQNVEMLSTTFVPNSLYTTYLTRDLNFENYCYRAAVEKKCLHSYVHPDRYDVWFNMTFLPLWPDDGNVCYCTYTMEINFEPSSERLSNISGDIASAVLETALMLRSSDDFKAAMKNTVSDIRKLCRAEYCCILLVDDENKTCRILGEDLLENTIPAPPDNYLETDFYPIASSWKDTISGSNCLIAKDERDMEVVAQRNPAWAESLRKAGVHTIALFPLRSRNERLGYMWAANFDADDATKIKEILELTTFVLGSETGNYLMMDRLKVLSSRDILTGLLNRNEMNLCVARLSEMQQPKKKTVGVIFFDLNGLKQINDSQGHRAGDAVLCNAADALRKVFDDQEIFRAGGDEYVVIRTGVTSGQIEENIASLKEAASQYPALSFATGYSVEEDCRDIRRALMEADERMYMDKKAYYEMASHDRRYRHRFQGHGSNCDDPQ